MQFIIFALIYPFIWLLSKLPMRVLYIISDILFLFVYHVFRYRRKVVFDNLGKAFPKKTDKEKKWISRNFSKHFTDLFIETIKAISISEKEIIKRYQYKNTELVNAYLKQGKSIAFISAHQGNWEWFASAPLVFNCRARGAYTSLGNRYFDKIVKASRERFGFICYDSSKTVKAFYEDYKQKKQSIYLLISDQSPQLEHSAYWKEFFGIKVPFHIGAESLAKKFDLVVINSSTKRIKRGYYETEFTLISNAPKTVNNYKIIDKYISLTETAIKKQPEFYLWSHKRFKHQHRFEEWKSSKRNKLKMK